MRGIAALPLIIIIVVAGGLGVFGYYNYVQQPEPESKPSVVEEPDEEVAEDSTETTEELSSPQDENVDILPEPEYIPPPPPEPEPEPEVETGTRAYGEIKFIDANYESNTSSKCIDRVFKKGTKLVTEDGLEFELVEDENPKCIRITSLPGLVPDADWDDWKKVLSLTSVAEASHVTIKAVESGRKYEIGEKVLLKVKDESLSNYAAFTISTFVGGSTGGL
jgi:hypothetical protein